MSGSRRREQVSIAAGLSQTELQEHRSERIRKLASEVLQVERLVLAQISPKRGASKSEIRISNAVLKKRNSLMKKEIELLERRINEKKRLLSAHKTRVRKKVKVGNPSPPLKKLSPLPQQQSNERSTSPKKRAPSPRPRKQSPRPTTPTLTLRRSPSSSTSSSAQKDSFLSNTMKKYFRRATPLSPNSSSSPTSPTSPSSSSSFFLSLKSFSPSHNTTQQQPNKSWTKSADEPNTNTTTTTTTTPINITKAKRRSSHYNPPKNRPRSSILDSTSTRSSHLSHRISRSSSDLQLNKSQENIDSTPAPPSPSSSSFDSSNLSPSNSSPLPSPLTIRTNTNQRLLSRTNPTPPPQFQNKNKDEEPKVILSMSDHRPGETFQKRWRQRKGTKKETNSSEFLLLSYSTIRHCSLCAKELSQLCPDLLLLLRISQKTDLFWSFDPLSVSLIPEITLPSSLSSLSSSSSYGSLIECARHYPALLGKPTNSKRVVSQNFSKADEGNRGCYVVAACHDLFCIGIGASPSKQREEETQNSKSPKNAVRFVVPFVSSVMHTLQTRFLSSQGPPVPPRSQKRPTFSSPSPKSQEILTEKSTTLTTHSLLTVLFEALDASSQAITMSNGVSSAITGGVLTRVHPSLLVEGGPETGKITIPPFLKWAYIGLTHGNSTVYRCCFQTGQTKEISRKKRHQNSGTLGEDFRFEGLEICFCFLSEGDFLIFLSDEVLRCLDPIALNVSPAFLGFSSNSWIVIPPEEAESSRRKFREERLTQILGESFFKKEFCAKSISNSIFSYAKSTLGLLHPNESVFEEKPRQADPSLNFEEEAYIVTIQAKSEFDGERRT